MTFWYTFFKMAIFRPLAKWWFRAKLIDDENIPEGGAILAANHLDYGDVLVLPSLVDQPLVFPAKKEFFHGKGVTGFIVRNFLKATGQAPMDRSGGRASAAGLHSLQDRLAEGCYVAIFPEGTRSPDGRMYKGHTGVARLALDHGKPVTPIGLVNTVLRRSKFGLPIMRGARVVCGKPLDFSDYVGRGNDREVLRWVTNEVMAAIQEITGQEYVDVYASRVKVGDLQGQDTSEYVLPAPNEGIEAPPLRSQESA